MNMVAEYVTIVYVHMRAAIWVLNSVIEFRYPA